MVTLTFHHQTGGRATQIDVVPVGAHRELILGRSPSAAIRFHATADRAVGRHHARLTCSTSSTTILLADLESRNGTFVNGTRVVASVPICSGDIVQLGREGPTVMILINVGPWASSVSDSNDTPMDLPASAARVPTDL